MKKQAIVSIVLSTLLLAMPLFVVDVSAEVIDLPEEWARIYDGPGNGNDFETSMVVDTDGNVYVTGQSWSETTKNDFATIKYDTDGNELWVARYDGPAGDNDNCREIALGPNGNVYVTGRSCVYGYNYDAVTVAYDTDGNELWVATYGGNGCDGSHAISVDPVSGTIYITGISSSYGFVTNYDCFTAAYDHVDGSTIWAKRYNDPENGWDSGMDIGVDGIGNVYVTGSSNHLATNYDYFTLSYDPAGEQRWVETYIGGNGIDYAQRMEVTPSGNVYVTGWSDSPGTGYDYATIAYDTDGNQLWVARYDDCQSASSYSDFPSGIAVDSFGNIYVTGYSNGDYATVAYDPEGDQLWVARYDGPRGRTDIARGIAVDVLGNIYVTGDSWGYEPLMGRATVAYDTDGNQLWVARYADGAGISVVNTIGKRIALDPQGNVYTIWRSYTEDTGLDYCTIKYPSTIDPLAYLDAIDDVFQDIDDDLLKNGNPKNTFHNQIEAVKNQIEAEDYLGAIDHLYEIRDNKVATWITSDDTEAEQAKEELTIMIENMITYLETLL